MLQKQIYKIEMMPTKSLITLSLDKDIDRKHSIVQRQGLLLDNT